MGWISNRAFAASRGMDCFTERVFYPTLARYISQGTGTKANAVIWSRHQQQYNCDSSIRKARIVAVAVEARNGCSGRRRGEAVVVAAAAAVIGTARQPAVDSYWLLNSPGKATVLVVVNSSNRGSTRTHTSTILRCSQEQEHHPVTSSIETRRDETNLLTVENNTSAPSMSIEQIGIYR